jgi:tripartite-type tricarboxylate transporter receptor subunit TctC
MKKFGVLFSLLLTISVAQAQSWTSQPIKLVVPYPAGGGADTVARLVSQYASNTLGQQIVIDNRPGAGTIIGADLVAHSKPDGYTIMLADLATLSTNSSLYKKLPYNPSTDFSPVTMVTLYPFVLASRKGFPAKNTDELLGYVRKNPGKVTFASPGLGSPHHLAMELFIADTKINLLHVPYKGAAPAMQDLIAGQVDLIFTDQASANNYIQDKDSKLEVFAAASPKRVAKFPKLPTLDEVGVKGFVANTWTAIVAPANTPKEVIEKLNKAYVEALKNPNVTSQLATLGVDPIPSTPEYVTEFSRSEAKRLGDIIKAKNISLE